MAFHHRPNEVAPESRPLVAAVHIASGLIEEMTEGNRAQCLGGGEPAGHVVGIADSLTETTMRIASAFIATLLVASTAFAHHSPIVFDRTKQVTLTGVVTEFRWGNPHSWIHIDVADADGKVGNWGIVLPSGSLIEMYCPPFSSLRSGKTTIDT